MDARRKPGTRPKGNRKAITVRVPSDQFEVIDEARQTAGYGNMCDYLAALLAKHHGLAVPSYARLSDQEELFRVG